VEEKAKKTWKPASSGTEKKGSAGKAWKINTPAYAGKNSSDRVEGQQGEFGKCERKSPSLGFQPAQRIKLTSVLSEN